MNLDNAVELVRKAAQIEVAIPLGAQARVWRGVEKKRARAAWRLALPMFALGAASAALILVFMRPSLSVKPLAEKVAARELPLSAEPELVDLQAAGKLVSGPNTAATLDRLDAGGVELSLRAGSLLVHVNPRKPGEAFLVHTPGFTVRVVGTVFRVAAGAAGASLVVGHGTVELMRPGSAPILVHAGERWPAQSVDLPSAAELAKLGAADLEGARFEPKLPSESELYAAGLQRLRARDLRGALAAFNEQRARFPEGVLRREAQASVIDTLLALKADTQARAEVDSYLREAPNGSRAAEMHFVRGTLYYAADHNCRRAAAEFDRALQRPAEPWASRARAARAACR